MDSSPKISGTPLPEAAYRGVKNGRKPRSQAHWNVKSSAMVFLRDQLSLSTWILCGAVLQTLVILSPIPTRMAIMPTLLFGFIRLLQGILHISSYKPGQDGIILGLRGTTVKHDAKSNGSMCLLVLGARSYHPLGAFAPAYRELLISYLAPAIRHLEHNPDTYDFLGFHSYIAADGGERVNEQIGLFYFRNYDGLHKFAHSKIHRDGWEWWHSIQYKYPYVGIFHETYDCPSGHWEGIYGNYRPSGLGATVFRYENEEGEQTWQTPLEDASIGQLRTSKGRMGRTAGDDNEKYSKSR